MDNDRRDININDTITPYDEENAYKGIILFGRDMTKIPCMRSSLLYGISGGVVTGLLTFLATSRPMLSSHVGVSTYVAGSLSYWIFCRYRWAVDKFNAAKMQAVFQDVTVMEGTEEVPVLNPPDKNLVDV